MQKKTEVTTLSRSSLLVWYYGGNILHGTSVFESQGFDFPLKDVGKKKSKQYSKILLRIEGKGNGF